MDAVVSTFHIEWKLIVVQLVNFAIVFFVLYRYALKPLAALMNDRKKTISQGVADAAINAVLVEQTKALFEQEKIKAQEQAQQLMHAMKKEIDEKRATLLADSHEQAEKILADTRAQLEQEKNKLIKEAHNAIADLVIQSTKKVLEDIPHTVDEALLHKAVKEL
ncbi:MAG: F0F1 ATP synthase subunit B [Candidatus Paceibacterota bacterium]